MYAPLRPQAGKFANIALCSQHRQRGNRLTQRFQFMVTVDAMHRSGGMPGQLLPDVGRDALISKLGNKMVPQRMEAFRVARAPLFPTGNGNTPGNTRLAHDVAELRRQALVSGGSNSRQGRKDESLGYTSWLTRQPIKKPDVQWNDNRRVGLLRPKAEQPSFQIQRFPPKVGDVAESQARRCSDNDRAFPTPFRVGNQRGDFIASERFPARSSRFRSVFYRIDRGAGICRDMTKPMRG